MTARASHKYLEGWAFTPSRSRHDYVCPDHTIADMMHEEYFDGIKDNLKGNDLIYITDAANQMMTVRIAHIDRLARKVEFDVIERFEFKPVVDQGNLRVRWRGPKGGKFCIVRGLESGESEIVERDFDTREQADHRIAQLTKAVAA